MHWMNHKVLTWKLQSIALVEYLTNITVLPCRDDEVCPGLVSAWGLPEAGVPPARLRCARLHQCRDSGHSLRQRQGVLHHHVHVLQVHWVNQTIIFSIPPSYWFSVQWQESRIVTDNNIEPGFWYPVSLEFLDYLWTPNIFIYNLKSFNSAKVLNRLAGKSFKYISKYLEFGSIDPAGNDSY